MLVQNMKFLEQLMLDIWYKAENISISAQELPQSLALLVKNWTFFNATSIYQIEEIGNLKNG